LRILSYKIPYIGTHEGKHSDASDHSDYAELCSSNFLNSIDYFKNILCHKDILQEYRV